MNKMLLIATFALTGTGLTVATAAAQVAGTSTTVEASVTTATQVARGWSVRKTLLGKTVYNDTGARIGKVEDLIVAPERNVTYVIVGAGGFIGIGRHDVAVPVSQIRDQGGRLVMTGATKESLQALPGFDDTSDTSRRDQFVAAAEQDVARAKVRIAELQKQSAAAAAADVKVRIDQQIAALQQELQASEEMLGQMKRAGARRWKEFEANVNAATARLRKSLDSTAG
ncbi:PRC-barrel domain protein [Sphaerotilus hippei]|uniref:PRC-barrel domain protein n=1 Tax=Sphaerotilus hippei TaxID=744406 RepID=A0A318GX16_9BURK|nr:PRC-barrel domain-containing protein [Sphaerotilus hippei]PXW93988.1 PRC-barrel domain protein [Sphaerotilus hippei]